MTSTVYLSGPITGLSYDEAKFGWREDFAGRILREGLPIRVLSPMRHKEHLRKSKSLWADGSKAIIERDLADIRRSDLMVVNVNGARRVSIGTMIEIGYATALGKPIVLIWNDEGNSENPHNHGWVTSLSAYWATDVEEAVKFVTAFLSEGL